MIIDTSLRRVALNGADSFDSLSFDDKALLLRFLFSHTNIIVVSYLSLSDPAAVVQINTAVDSIEAIVGTRMSRVAAWTGTGGVNINDTLSNDSTRYLVSLIIPTMTSALNQACGLFGSTVTSLRVLKLRLVQSIDFKHLLSDHSETRLSQICHCVGHWAFPAHELSNDDLVYCVYLILEFAIQCVISFGLPEGLVIPNANEILALAFMTRDTYRSGNPFHNFRHAVDVLQACFHYLIRLKCLPRFEQLEQDPRADETHILSGKKRLHPSVTLMRLKKELIESDFVPLLTPIQSLGLLVAALGHDVGHPGVTNAYMIKHSAPTSQIYNDRSVLELYHSAIFTNKVLNIMWPSFLNCKIGEDSDVNTKQLIIRSILATDMAEHFEYIHKLKDVLLILSTVERVQLICSLLIKCADISNVTRPLRVSSHWALILSREFDEVDKLEKKISAQESMMFDISYSQLPVTLEGVLEANPYLHKSQIFFINAFAEGLFNSILDHFAELKYTSDIIDENKLFWQARAEKLD